jgi:hypothetical protein
VDSILEYANTLAADPHFNSAFNTFATYPEVNVHLQLLRIEVEVHGIETDVYAATVSRDRVRLNQKVLDRIGAISPSREADLLQVFLAYVLAAHEVGHVLIRHDETQEYRMTPDDMEVPFVEGGKEAGRFLENVIYKGVLQLICRRNLRWTSEYIKALRLMLITNRGEKALDTDQLIAAFQQRIVIPMPITGPLVLAHHEIVRKESGLKFKHAVQYGGEELDSQCGIFAFPDPPRKVKR